jgi:hypothetical protein
MSKSIRFFFLILISISLQFIVFAQEESTKIKKLSKNADVIVTGKVTHRVSNWNESKTRIYTKTTVQVDEFLKGADATNSVDIVSPGGEVGEVGEIYSHMPRFEDDEEVLVFLRKDKKDSHFKVLSGEQGKIKVLNDPKSKSKVTGSNKSLKDLKFQIKSYLDDKE